VPHPDLRDFPLFTNDPLPFFQTVIIQSKIYTDPILVFPKTDTKSYNMSAKQLRLTAEANFVPEKT
jgi:hypothetical protein